jgi:SPP1 gp7 family putative phage head morphogenesis protein
VEKPCAIFGPIVRMLRRKEKVLRAVHANQGLAAIYRKKLQDFVEDLHSSIEYWVCAAYKANEPEVVDLAQDDMSSTTLRDALRRLIRRWRWRIDETAGKLAKWFAQAAAARSDAALRRILKEGGFSVEFKLTRAQRDVLNATVHQNVGLIKSIGQEYLSSVEGAVMRSVQTGRDVGALTKELQDRFKVTKKRAALIARDQNQKSTAALQRVRYLELGLTEAIWMHSSAGKTFRRTHVAMHGKKFDVIKGFWDTDEKAWVLPGTLINCKCSSRPILKGFS